MHMVGPYLSTTNNKERKPKKLRASEIRAREEHEAFLRRSGVHPDQLAARPSTRRGKLTHIVKPVSDGPACTNGFALGGAKTSVFDSEWQKTYEHDPEMAQREKIALAQAQALKGRLTSLYNKGPVMLMTQGLKMTDLGKRRP